MGACWHAPRVYARVEETGKQARERETNDRKIQSERNDADERAKEKEDEKLARTVSWNIGYFANKRNVVATTISEQLSEGSRRAQQSLEKHYLKEVLETRRKD
ncbi:hypothetical protein PUN28_011761 [Cardiocondyla obscurior]|uniref:Uncharacterized protein n=1 Tax=Cardiocondyla obscurior TaxID=286306 RepID=A0AAW2FFF3_9HYME